MATQHQPPTSSRRHRRMRARQGGFNFTEVLFAVMILGIGFIMVAAIFPVALQQTKLTGEEVVASTVARGGINYVQQVAATAGVLPVTDLNIADPAAIPPGPADVAPLTPEPPIPPGQSRYVPGKVISFRDDRLHEITRDILWRSIGGNFILPEDNRVGWVGMYRRGATYVNVGPAAALPGDAGVLAKPDPFAQVFIVSVQVRNRSRYELDKDLRRYPDDDPPAAATNSSPATLEPVTVFVKTSEGDLGPDTITFFGGPASTAPLSPAAAGEGAYVIISDDRLPENLATPQRENGRHNGKVYRLGAPRTDIDAGTWELAPGQDMAFTDPDGTPGNADDVHENIPDRPVSPGPPPTTGDSAFAFIVGRGHSDPANPAGGYDGLAQDVGFFVGFVPAN